MNTKKSNKLIAEFMGVTLVKDIQIGLDHIDEAWKMGDTYFKYLDYHNSWDWLMPVLDKIKSLDKYWQYFLYVGDYFVTLKIVEADGPPEENEEVFSANYNSMHENIEKSSINYLYLCIVDFIKWYNEYKGSKEN